MRTRNALWVGILIGLASLAGGCTSSSGTNSGSDGPTAADDLFEVGGLIKDHVAATGRAPSRLEDTANNQPLYARGYAAVQSGQIVVIWGVPVSDEITGERIVAYEKKVQTEGGNVLLENGKVKTMTAAEFQAAPKAK